MTDNFKFCKGMLGVVYGAVVLGQNSSFMANYAEAIQAGGRLLGLIDQVPNIDVTSKSGHRPISCTGHISVKNIHFQYPTRPDHIIFSKFSIEILPGETIALVGESGQGKSTLLQLIQRFYDLNKGRVFCFKS